MNVQNIPSIFSLNAAARDGALMPVLFARSNSPWLQQPDLVDFRVDFTDYGSLPWSSSPVTIADRTKSYLLPLRVALSKLQTGQSQKNAPALHALSCQRLIEPEAPQQATWPGLQAGASQQLAHPTDKSPQGKKNFLAESRQPVPESAVQKTTAGSQPERQPLRILAIGTRQAVIQTVHTLFLLGFAEVGEWSPLLPGPNPGEVMSILTRSMPTD